MPVTAKSQRFREQREPSILGLYWPKIAAQGDDAEPQLEQARICLGEPAGIRCPPRVDACPTWDDFRTWGGVRLLFRKRAQLCVAMIRGRLKGQGLGHFPDLEPLTAFADYRLPQSLQGLGVMVCDEALRAEIAAGRQIEAGSEAEIALRAATIVGAEDLRAALVDRGHRVNALHVDYFLWRYAVDHDAELPRFHRTRTTDY